jgi:hypothetical protein
MVYAHGTATKRQGTAAPSGGGDFVGKRGYEAAEKAVNAAKGATSE